SSVPAVPAVFKILFSKPVSKGQHKHPPHPAAFKVPVKLVGLRVSAPTALVEQVTHVKHNTSFSVQHVPTYAGIDNKLFDSAPLGHYLRSTVLSARLGRKRRHDAVICGQVGIPVETIGRCYLMLLTSVKFTVI